jgi:hypothetical protein
MNQEREDYAEPEPPRPPQPPVWVTILIAVGFVAGIALGYFALRATP